jgi:hypothetical protein
LSRLPEGVVVPVLVPATITLAAKTTTTTITYSDTAFHVVAVIILTLIIFVIGRWIDKKHVWDNVLVLFALIFGLSGLFIQTSTGRRIALASKNFLVSVSGGNPWIIFLVVLGLVVLSMRHLKRHPGSKGVMVILSLLFLAAVLNPTVYMVTNAVSDGLEWVYALQGYLPGITVTRS